MVLRSVGVQFIMKVLCNVFMHGETFRHLVTGGQKRRRWSVSRHPPEGIVAPTGAGTPLKGLQPMEDPCWSTEKE